MTPVAAVSERPVGKLPDVMDQTYGVCPPVAASVTVYATFVVALGNGDVVVIDSGLLIVTVYAWVASLAALSLTCTVKVVVAAVVGVPLMTPVPDTMVRPAGNDPTEIDHVKGAVPPVSLTVCE